MTTPSKSDRDAADLYVGDSLGILTDARKEAFIAGKLEERNRAKVLLDVLKTLDNEFMVKYQVARSGEGRGYYSYTWQSFDAFLKLIRKATQVYQSQTDGEV